MIRLVDHFCQGVADLFADILCSGEEDDGLGDDETEEEVDEDWERESKLEGRLRGLGKSQWGDEMEWGGRGEARGERLPRSESSSPHKLHPARWDIHIVTPLSSCHELEIPITVSIWPKHLSATASGSRRGTRQEQVYSGSWDIFLPSLSTVAST